MSHSKDADEGNSLEFKWGKKLGAGAHFSEIQYFESFLYDGVEYFLYDCVYMYVKDAVEPDIGKIVKIWDHPKHPKRVEIVWFFRPNEIRNWLGDVVPCDKEIFLACGEGVGFSNDNKLEAIAGKCNIVCTSKDKRNPQPSKQELIVADYIFYRTFDVGKFTISDKIGDKIAENDVRHFLNKGKPQQVILDPIATEFKGTTVSGFDQRGKTSISHSGDKAKLISLKIRHSGTSGKISSQSLTLGESVKHAPKKEPSDSSSLRVQKDSGFDQCVKSPIRHSEDKAKLNSLKIQHSGTAGKSSLQKFTQGESVKHAPPKVPSDSSSFGVQKESSATSRQVEDRAKLQSSKRLDQFGASDNRLKPQDNVLSPLKVGKDKTAVPVHKLRVSSGEDAGKSSGSYVRTSDQKLKSGPDIDYIEQGREIYNSMSKLTKNAPMFYNKTDPVVGHGIESDSRILKAAQPDKDLIEHNREISTKLNRGKLTRLSDEVPSKLAQKKPNITDFEVHEVIERPHVSMPKLSKNAPMFYDNTDPVVGHGIESDSRVLKAAQPDKDLIEQNREISTKLNRGKLTRLSDEGLSKPAQKKPNITDFEVHEVIERPHDRSKWFNFRASWEDKIADAYTKGTLVLFQNLDPSYTSKEIEGLVWSALGEKCVAGVLQRSTYSSPHYGQAFVVFDTTQSAEAVLMKLQNGCLMLPNGRALIAEVGIPRKPRKQSTFVGHLSIDKLDNQKQREEKKNAVSTAHFSQPNTIEYDMAVEWLLLHKRSERQFETLFQRHGEELAGLKAQLKST